MDLCISFFTLSKIGLLLNIVGTFMVIFSYDNNFMSIQQIDKKGKSSNVSTFTRPRFFTWGLLILVIGFLFQLFD